MSVLSRKQLESVIARNYRNGGMSDEAATKRATADVDRNIKAGTYTGEGDEIRLLIATDEMEAQLSDVKAQNN